MKLPVVVLSVLLLSGCVSARERFVVIPLQSTPVEKIEQDRADCEAFAKANRNNNELVQGSAFGAVAGAGAGALNGAVYGAYWRSAGTGAAVGAGTGAAMGLAAGAIAGAVADYQRYLRIYHMCMSLRGYAVTGMVSE